MVWRCAVRINADYVMFRRQGGGGGAFFGVLLLVSRVVGPEGKILRLLRILGEKSVEASDEMNDILAQALAQTRP